MPIDPKLLKRDVGDFSIVAAAQGTPWAQKSAAKRRAQTEARSAARNDAQDTRSKYTAQTQPRDSDGKFRKILARLKLNLGGESTQDLAQEIEATEVAQVAGDYEKMKDSSNSIIKMINAIEDGQLPKGVTKNLRKGASDLGRVLAYLPLPQGDANAKIRFTDLPPASSELVRSMVKKVKERLSPEDAAKYIDELNSFMSGSRTMTSDEMAVNLNKLLRVLA